MIFGILKWTVLFYGLVLLSVGIFMLIIPEKARQTLKKAGSTTLIHYVEITIYLLSAIALILYSEHTKFPILLEIIGWFMALISVVLFMLPRHLHQKFALGSADLLKPTTIRYVSLIAILFAGFIIYAAL